MEDEPDKVPGWAREDYECALKQGLDKEKAYELYLAPYEGNGDEEPDPEMEAILEKMHTPVSGEPAGMPVTEPEPVVEAPVVLLAPGTPTSANGLLGIPTLSYSSMK